MIRGYNDVPDRPAREVLAVRKADEEVAQKRKKVSRKKVNSNQLKKDCLTADDIEHFKEMLLAKRQDIIGDVKEIRDEALKRSRLEASGDLSSMPIHMADIGTDNYEQEFALDLMSGERKLLREIDDALGRIGQGVYGICEGTGKPISKARLKAQPWARCCVEYARMLEQGLVAEQEEHESEDNL